MLNLPLPNETMKHGPTKFVTIFLVVVLALACDSKDKPIVDRAEINAPTFTMRITEFEEKRFPLSKFCYVFEVKPSGSTEWMMVMNATTDDDVPIPRDQVRVISKEAAYVFMGDKYAVTRNGGRAWSVWNVNDSIGNVEYPGQFFINEVRINSDGTGTIVLVSRSTDRQILQFRTNDFGQSWRQ
ncbi:MAG TPA: hypothetical protein VJR02_19190 [Pyrinomonadaceae bacterium]|nr:hypothetical protein [Pyrinomonadaceae bacterium]